VLELFLFFPLYTLLHWPGWLGSRVVSVLDSGAEGPSSNRSRDAVGNSPRQTVHTHCASVHQAAKLVAALLRVAGVTAGLAESNGSLPPGLWPTSPAGWLPRTGISSGTLRSVIEYGLPFYTLLQCERDFCRVHRTLDTMTLLATLLFSRVASSEISSEDTSLSSQRCSALYCLLRLCSTDFDGL